MYFSPNTNKHLDFISLALFVGKFYYSTEAIEDRGQLEDNPVCTIGYNIQYRGFTPGQYTLGTATQDHIYIGKALTTQFQMNTTKAVELK